MCLPRQSPIGEYTAIDHAASDTLTSLHIACKLGLDLIAHAIVDYAQWMVRVWAICISAGITSGAGSASEKIAQK